MIFRKKRDYYIADGSSNELIRDYRDAAEQNTDEEKVLELRIQIKSLVRMKLRQQHKVTPVRILNIDVDERGMIRVRVVEKRV